jgi:hypothetical protein
MLESSYDFFSSSLDQHSTDRSPALSLAVKLLKSLEDKTSVKPGLHVFFLFLLEVEDVLKEHGELVLHCLVLLVFGLGNGLLGWLLLFHGLMLFINVGIFSQRNEERGRRLVSEDSKKWRREELYCLETKWLE